MTTKKSTSTAAASSICGHIVGWIPSTPWERGWQQLTALHHAGKPLALRLSVYR